MSWYDSSSALLGRFSLSLNTISLARSCPTLLWRCTEPLKGCVQLDWWERAWLSFTCEWFGNAQVPTESVWSMSE